MVEITRQRLEDAGVFDRTGLSLADGVQTPFRSGCFDAVFMSFTLELFDTPEIPKVLFQCRRMLRPGGRLVLVVMVKTIPPGYAERIYEWFHARMPVLVDCRPIDAQTALQQSGFTISDVITDSMWGLPVEIISAEK
jgi:demethylmenaquinone methyltransferase/2-methoxy-6-polyprenyl-1,4-benzoquinol methylase